MGAAKKTEPTGEWQAWVNLKWKSGVPDSAWQEWKGADHVKGIWTTNGNWDCTVWVDVDNPADLEKFVWKNIRTNKWVDSTNTHWVKQWW